MMRIGQLNRRVDLQQPSGLSGDGYVRVATVWAAMRSTGGGEAVRFGGTSSTGQVVLTLRFRDDIRSEWRAYESASGRVFQIAHYGDPDGTRQWVELFCQESQ